jgi:hypothetical protein
MASEMHLLENGNGTFKYRQIWSQHILYNHYCWFAVPTRGNHSIVEHWFDSNSELASG